MKKKSVLTLLVIFSCFSWSDYCWGNHEHKDMVSLWDVLVSGETQAGMANNVEPKLEQYGIDIDLGYTNIYQINANGGLDTSKKAGRYTGSWDLELNFDLEKISDINNASVFMLVGGSWPRAEGINEQAVGSIFGVNGDAAGRRDIDVYELWFEHQLFDGKLQYRIGKLDMAGTFQCSGCPVSFDGSTFANDETAQFLNAALVNNPTIPLPDYGLGAIVNFSPVEAFYVSLGVADAQADGRETGFNTTFHGEDDFFYIFETGLLPKFQVNNDNLQGAYRFGLWYDPQAKDKFDGSGIKRDDNGCYVSFDQEIYKENSEDDQGLGTFARWGYSSSDVEPELSEFWSAGMQYRGLFESRDDDVLAAGFAYGTLSDQLDGSDELAIELYYSIQISQWSTISPSIQYIADPGANEDAGDALVFGIRAQMAF
ncbi:MAG: carbohydrate porin [Phycisphaerae bacterium]|nr:carbohydrate porin [Phycisphaerae bacterium]